MKYTCSIEINGPVEKVAALWEDEKKFKEWQDGFVSIELLEGTVGSVGAKSKIVFQDRNRIELIETIISNSLPNEKIALYEHVHMTNTQLTRFEPLKGDRTLYVSEMHYTQFNGLLIKMIAKLFPSKFRAQSQKWMSQFKSFAEKEMQNRAYN